MENEGGEGGKRDCKVEYAGDSKGKDFCPLFLKINLLGVMFVSRISVCHFEACGSY